MIEVSETGVQDMESRLVGGEPGALYLHAAKCTYVYMTIFSRLHGQPQCPFGSVPQEPGIRSIRQHPARTASRPLPTVCRKGTQGYRLVFTPAARLLQPPYGCAWIDFVIKATLRLIAFATAIAALSPGSSGTDDCDIGFYIPCLSPVPQPLLNGCMRIAYWLLIPIQHRDDGRFELILLIQQLCA